MEAIHGIGECTDFVVGIVRTRPSIAIHLYITKFNWCQPNQRYRYLVSLVGKVPVYRARG